MQVNIRGKDKYIPLSGIKERIENKLQKLNQYFRNSDALIAEVRCGERGAKKVLEVTIPTKHIMLRAEVTADNFPNATDELIDKLETQIRRHKSKIESSIKRRGGVKAHYSEARKAEIDLEKVAPIENLKTLVKEKEVTLEPITREEAILEMEMSGHDFYLYLDKNTHKTAVVYLRKDGNYGVINDAT